MPPRGVALRRPRAVLQGPITVRRRAHRIDNQSNGAKSHRTPSLAKLHRVAAGNVPTRRKYDPQTQQDHISLQSQITQKRPQSKGN